MNTWTWILTTIGITSLIIVGNHRWWGFLIAFCNECLYLVFSIKYNLWGFTVAAIVYGVINLRNAYRWRNNDIRPRASGTGNS